MNWQYLSLGIVGILLIISLALGVPIPIAIGTAFITFTISVFFPPPDIEFLYALLVTPLIFYFIRKKYHWKKAKVWAVSYAIALTLVYVLAIICGIIGVWLIGHLPEEMPQIIKNILR